MRILFRVVTRWTGPHLTAVKMDGTVIDASGETISEVSDDFEFRAAAEKELSRRVRQEPDKDHSLVEIRIDD